MQTDNQGGPRLLVTDRESAVYLEHARIHVENSRIVYHITDDDQRREYNIPHVNTAVLFMGQGTSITQEAMRLLGQEGVHLACTGSGGSPLHMGGLTTYSGTRHFRELLPIYLDKGRSLNAAKSVMSDRALRIKEVGSALTSKYLRQRDTQSLTHICRKLDERLSEFESIVSLLGYEAGFSKYCYGAFARISRKSSPESFRRVQGTGGSGGDEDSWSLVNRMIDHGDYLCYGMAGAALWALGIPPHMSVFHGRARPGGLIYDIADSFKDAFVLPIAFSMRKSAKQQDAEKIFRGKLIKEFDDKRVLSKAINTVNNMIIAGQNRKWIAPRNLDRIEEEMDE